MNRAQYDDIYHDWYEGKVYIEFGGNLEDEEAFARHLARLHH